MRIGLLLALLLVACGSVLVPIAATPEQAAVLLKFNDGSCGGTVIGPHAILTAAHCFEDKSVLKSVNNLPAKEVRRIGDNNEHVIVLVDVTFDRWARIGNKPAPGSRVRLLGHPFGLPRMYREGVVAGNYENVPCYYVKRPKCVVTLLDMNTALGDSGSGLFDESGHVVGVNTGWIKINQMWQMKVALPLAFTSAQYAEAQ